LKIFIDYKGNKVRLTEERLQHIVLHPEMIDMLDIIEETLINPDYVIQSKQDVSVLMFNKYYITRRFGNKYLCVIVKENENDRFIVTSYIMSKLPKGEVLWQRN